MTQTLQFELTPSVAGWTIEEFLEHIAKEAGVDRTTEKNNQMRRYMDIILAEILESFTEWSWAHSSSSFDTKGQLAGDYSLGELDFAFLDGHLQTADAPVFKVPLHELRSLQTTAPTEGRPEYFALVGENSVVLYPTPDGIYTISYDYERKFSSFLDLTTSEGIQIPLQFQNMLIFGVSWMMRAADNANDPISIRMERRYQGSIASYMFRETAGEVMSVQGDIPAGK